MAIASGPKAPMYLFWDNRIAKLQLRRCKCRLPVAARNLVSAEYSSGQRGLARIRSSTPRTSMVKMFSDRSYQLDRQRGTVSGRCETTKMINKILVNILEKKEIGEHLSHFTHTSFRFPRALSPSHYLLTANSPFGNFLHSGQSHSPAGSLLSPTQLQWNH
jgi:hypothetical protein